MTDIQLPPDSRWTIKEVMRGGRHTKAKCVCACGKEKTLVLSRVTRGDSKSCGCLRRDMSRIKNTTHGHSKNGHKSTVYGCWRDMKQRCENPVLKDYPRYGGRGIRVCKSWSESFEAFLADMGSPPPKHTLDRIDNFGNYEPGNCRWATRKEQQRNTRTNRCVNYNGKEMTLSELAETVGMARDVLNWRIVYGGWSVERAVTTPVQTKFSPKRKEEIDG